VFKPENKAQSWSSTNIGRRNSQHPPNSKSLQEFDKKTSQVSQKSTAKLTHPMKGTSNFLLRLQTEN